MEDTVYIRVKMTEIIGGGADLTGSHEQQQQNEHNETSKKYFRGLRLSESTLKLNWNLGF